jgi:hypothetical protein
MEDEVWGGHYNQRKKVEESEVQGIECIINVDIEVPRDNASSSNNQCHYSCSGREIFRL